MRARIGFALLLAATMVAVPAPFATGQEEPFSIAVFGNNEIDNYLNTAGFEATLVSDAELSTEGFLANFDAFFYTRNGFETPGPSLSAAAAANVQEYVGSSGRAVLLNGDFADTLLGQAPDAQVQQLISNATSWAAETHHGYIGEYTGAVAGLTNNANDLTSLGFVAGSAGLLSNGPAEGTVVQTAAGEGSPILAGVAFPLTDLTNELSFGSIVTGVHSSLVLAQYSNPGQPNDGNPAIIATSDLTIDKTDEPDPVTAGGALRYSLTIANGGEETATSVVVVDTLPSTTTFVSASEGCTHSTGVVTCQIASLSPGATASFEIVVTTSTAGTIRNVADVSATNGADHVEEDTTVQPQSTRDAAVEFCPDGCTVTTDTGAGATRDDNTVSTLIVPDEAAPQTVSITEAAASTQPTFCGGTTCNGQLVTISNITGVSNPNDPIRLEITFDKTVKGGTQIYIQKPPLAPRLVPNCTAPGVASPHPCVTSKMVLANGDRTIVVLLLTDDPILGKK
jgi:uncharacterized repeat protein (TIGR01451 family)